MNPAEIRAILSQGDCHYPKEERFGNKKERLKKRKSQRDKREKPEWKKR